MFLTKEQLEKGLPHIQASPKELGTVEMIVRRPEENAREELSEAELDTRVGVVGDNWATRGSSRTSDGTSHPDMQLNLMNSRVIDLVATERARWGLAGDQFFVDLDLSYDNLPPGTQLSLGDAIIEITAEPHAGCAKFVERFGKDATIFLNGKAGRALNLRGVNAKVVKGGKVKSGSSIQKLSPKKPVKVPV